jgi:hypothetical protein
MCISMRPATFDGTKIYVGEAIKDNKYVHVLAYQNSAESLDGEPNAMILPFPTSVSMNQDNVIDTSSFKNFLTNIADASKIQTDNLRRGFTKGALNFACAGKAQIFDVGSYTVILAEKASQIPAALKQVPEDKRPKISYSLLNYFNKQYPDVPIAVCCWSGTVNAEPLLWWYEPKNKDVLFVPAMDSHDGKALDFTSLVKRNHVISTGSSISMEDRLSLDTIGRVFYKDTIPDNVKSLLPKHSFGTKFQTNFYGDISGYHDMRLYKNSDMIIKTAQVRESKPPRIFDGDKISEMAGWLP